MLSGELIQQIICFEAATVFCDKLKYPAAYRGKPNAARVTLRFCLLQ